MNPKRAFFPPLFYLYHHNLCLLKPRQCLSFTLSTLIYTNPLLASPRDTNFTFNFPSSSSYSSQSHPENPRFPSNEGLEKLRFLEDFRYSRELKSGSMWVRVMREEDLDDTVGLIAESFAESTVVLPPSVYASVLRFVHKEYLTKRMNAMPHMAMLLGFYREDEEGGDDEHQVHLAGAVEVYFDNRGAIASLPTPTPPIDSPYICNMAVKTSLRRRGIGWHLLKASEELISRMSSTREVYLHCRVIDAAPFYMYLKADYKVVKTDSIFSFLMLQRRKHLMCKNLPSLSNHVESHPVRF